MGSQMKPHKNNLFYLKRPGTTRTKRNALTQGITKLDCITSKDRNKMGHRMQL